MLFDFFGSDYQTTERKRKDRTGQEGKSFVFLGGGSGKPRVNLVQSRVRLA